MKVLVGLLLSLLLSCAARPPDVPKLAMSTVEGTRAEVRYRVQEPQSDLAKKAVAAVPDSVWDGGLNQAVEELLGLATHRSFSLDPQTTSLVAARAGFPGQVRFSWTVNHGELPMEMLGPLAGRSGPEVYLALGKRNFGDGTVLWMLGWSQKWADIDPLPRDLELDEPINIHVELTEATQCQLFIRPPHGPIQEISLTNGVARWVDRFHTPGEYRIEVVAARGQVSRVVLLFSVFVDGPPPEPGRLRMVPSTVASPIEAEAWLYQQLNEMRTERGLPTVTRFELFEPVVREHSAFMGAYGSAVHSVPGVTQGVAWTADNLAHPRARHHESVATAVTVSDILFLIGDSPGHLDKLLCETCTHASIGVALEPVLDRFPRLFVTVDLLEFPQGPPQKIER